MGHRRETKDGETVGNEVTEDELKDRRDMRAEKEEALLEGFGREDVDQQLQSPDDVTILVSHSDGPDNTIQIIVQLEETKAAVRVLAEGFCNAFRESKTRKGSYLYFFSFLLGCLAFAHGMYFVWGSGFPVTAESSSAMIRFVLSAVTMMVISILAFFIINVQISSMFLGLFWMFMVVSLQYFNSTSFTGSAFFMYQLTQKNDNLTIGKQGMMMRKVVEHLQIYYSHNYERKEPYLLTRLAMEGKCCNYKLEADWHSVDKKLRKRLRSVWDAVFLNFSIVPQDALKKEPIPRPPSCCLQSAKKKGQCQNVKKCNSETPAPCLKKRCKKSKLLIGMQTSIVILIGYSIVMQITSVAMALVFWHYYSRIKAREFALEEPPGDFAVLNIERPHIQGEKLELTLMERLKRQRKKMKLSKLRMKYSSGLGHESRLHRHGGLSRKEGNEPYEVVEGQDEDEGESNQ